MNRIKERRLNELRLTSHSDLHVGDCVPFYFCPRSIMLFLISKANHVDLQYREGQGPIIHLVADLYASVTWAQSNNQRWAFTLSNAGAYYFEDRNDLAQLDEINWAAVSASRWGGTDVPSEVAEGKQAEFLMEKSFPWHLVERIGVYSQAVHQQVSNALLVNGHRPQVEIARAWYY